MRQRSCCSRNNDWRQPHRTRRLVLWLTVLWGQMCICLLVQYQISLRIPTFDAVWGLNGSSYGQGYTSMSPLLLSHDWRMKMYPLKLRNASASSGTGRNAGSRNDTVQVVSLNLSIHDNPVIQQHKTLKLQMPSTYRNVNYTLSNKFARPFPMWQRSFPCFPSEPDWYTLDRQRTPTRRGFFYFKARKAASSTVAGVALRIARSKGRQMQMQPLHHLPNTTNNNNNATNVTTITTSTTTTTSTHCHTRFGHPAASRLTYHQRDRLNSFLWSIIREPTHRDVSEFFHFGVSRSKIQPSRQTFQHYYRSTPGMLEYYLQFMSTTPVKEMSMLYRQDDSIELVRKIILDYDFIGISERMHESLVTLQLLLNLTTSDILVLNAKTNGGWDDGMSKQNQQQQRVCTYIQPSVVSPELQQYFQSEEWMREKHGSNLLYATVNRSLDLTIASLDPTHFQDQLRRYKWALQQAQARCSSKVRYPCSAEGVVQEQHDCLLWDSGCGNDCLDELSRELGL